MNKQIVLCTWALLVAAALQAQRPATYQTDEEKRSGLSANKIFVGGSLNVGFASNTFQLGAVPEIGYSFTDWFDAGIGININYASQRADPNFIYNANTRYRTLNYGGGPFVRFYPIHFLFVQGQFEQNWIKQNATDYANGQSGKATYKSKSLIAGVGYTQRIVGENSFYTMIGIDLLTDRNSPYRDAYSGAAIPVIRAGFDFYLKPKRR